MQKNRVPEKIKMEKYLGTLGTCDKGFANVSDTEDRWSLDIIPVLLGKRIRTTMNKKNSHSNHP